MVLAQLSALGLAYLVDSNLSILLPFLLTGVLLLGLSKFLTNYSLVGRYFLITNALLIFSGIVWTTWFLATIPVSSLTRVLIFSAAPLILILLPSGLVQFLEQFEVLCRKIWIRPRRSLPIIKRVHYPKVSLHVPTYAEPPELVIQTLRALSRLDYPNFEVIVIDNNTQDARLWQPVQAYCQTLGSQFHFFHVDGMKGAKGGALNFALTKTATDSQLIGVVDADYQARPDFLKSLVGYFDDPTMGFVQTPHDYRGWENNPYLRMCYYEYKIFFHTTMVSLNEQDAALTVGTMCLIRKQALDQVGGWAEWCVTEDSELSIRIHAAGYSSVYLTESFGQGLIPETFAGYKRQRYRWTAGPVQEFKHHFNLLMLWPFRKPSLLTLAQRIHHLNHGLDRFTLGLILIFMPLGLGVIASMIYHREVVEVPFVLWLAATVLLVSGVVLNWLLYKTVLNCSFKDTLGALLANKALSHTTAMASLKATFSDRLPWQRTNKFKASSTTLRTFSATKVELILGISILTLAVGAFSLLPLPGLLLMFLIGLSYKGLDYLSAPLVALLAKRSLEASG